MTTKANLLRLSSDLEKTFKEIQTIADDNPSLVSYFGSGDDKFVQSFSSFTDAFEPRLEYFRRGLNKYADVILDEQKKEKRAKAHEAEKKPKGKRGRKKKDAVQ